MSLPYDRDMDTISPSPNLASHAPKVNRTTVIAVLGASMLIRTKGTNNTNLSVIPSRDNKVIRKCVWLNNIFVIARIGSRYMIVKVVLFIELREFSIFDLQGRCLNISFQFFRKRNFSEHWHPRSVFYINYYLYVIFIYISSMKS